MELSLSDADDARPLAPRIMKGCEGEDIGILIDLEAGAFQGCLKPLEFRRKNTILKLHGCGRVLHSAVVDYDNLLDVTGNGRFRVARKLGRRTQRGRKREGCDGKERLENLQC